MENSDGLEHRCAAPREAVRSPEERAQKRAKSEREQQKNHKKGVGWGDEEWSDFRLTLDKSVLSSRSSYQRCLLPRALLCYVLFSQLFCLIRLKPVLNTDNY